MKKLFFLVVTLLALLPLAQGQSTKYVFNNDPEQYLDSIVRIFCFNPDDPSKGIPYADEDLGDGVHCSVMDVSFGTGFVINKEGYIVTNNHVAALDASSRIANSVIMVVETVTTPGGKKRIAHKAKVLWLSPENDLAILQCNNVRANPIPLDTGEVHGQQTVYTMGYPGMSDEIALNHAQAQLLYEHAKRNLINNTTDTQVKAHPEWKGKVPDDTLQQIVDKADAEAQVLAQSSNFLDCIGAIAEVINPTWNSQDTWDITDVISRSPSWPLYFEATQNDGKVQRIVNGTSWSPDAQMPVPMIQHNINVQHGNSGGPLLSDRGGVIGVVGDGMGDTHEGDRESVNFATQIVQVTSWLEGDHSRHYEKLFYIPSRTMVLICLGLLVVAVALAYMSFNSRSTAPILAQGGQGGAAIHGVTPPSKNGLGKKGENTILPGKPGSGWMLAGQAQGRNLKVEFNEGLFNRNGGRLIIGRSPELSHLVLETDDVSRQHAQIRKEGGSFFIADRNSSNRTAVNGQFTGAPFAEVSLREGDTLTFGEAKLEFRRV